MNIDLTTGSSASRVSCIPCGQEVTRIHLTDHHSYCILGVCVLYPVTHNSNDSPLNHMICQKAHLLVHNSSGIEESFLVRPWSPVSYS
jgi:hypothetical protein